MNKNKIKMTIKKFAGSKRFHRFLVTSLAFGLMYTKYAYAAGGDWDGFGIRFWGYVKIAAKWGCLIMCGISIVKSMETTDAKSIASTVFKYAIIYAVIIMLPKLFEEIASILS